MQALTNELAKNLKSPEELIQQSHFWRLIRHTQNRQLYRHHDQS